MNELCTCSSSEDCQWKVATQRHVFIRQRRDSGLSVAFEIWVHLLFICTVIKKRKEADNKAYTDKNKLIKKEPKKLGRHAGIQLEEENLTRSQIQLFCWPKKVEYALCDLCDQRSASVFHLFLCSRPEWSRHTQASVLIGNTKMSADFFWRTGGICILIKVIARIKKKKKLI